MELTACNCDQCRGREDKGEKFPLYIEPQTGFTYYIVHGKKKYINLRGRDGRDGKSTGGGSGGTQTTVRGGQGVRDQVEVPGPNGVMVAVPSPAVPITGVAGTAVPFTSGSQPLVAAGSPPLVNCVQVVTGPQPNGFLAVGDVMITITGLYSVNYSVTVNNTTSCSVGIGVQVTRSANPTVIDLASISTNEFVGTRTLTYSYTSSFQYEKNQFARIIVNTSGAPGTTTVVSSTNGLGPGLSDLVPMSLNLAYIDLTTNVGGGTPIVGGPPCVIQ